jgi:hypothetical protein
MFGKSLSGAKFYPCHLCVRISVVKVLVNTIWNGESIMAGYVCILGSHLHVRARL